jgi:hypothetical protein
MNDTGYKWTIVACHVLIHHTKTLIPYVKKFFVDDDGNGTDWVKMTVKEGTQITNSDFMLVRFELNRVVATGSIELSDNETRHRYIRHDYNDGEVVSYDGIIKWDVK